uniref:Uncharacterized protein n=1 Tax=Anopheles minimus TaxID=112268 RepID=A0A182WPH1_9DIPT
MAHLPCVRIIATGRVRLHDSV